MANMVVNELTITGDDVRQVLDYIGFDPDGVRVDRVCDRPAVPVLIDFNRIAPLPNEKLDFWGLLAWLSINWGTEAPCAYEEGDIHELTDSKAQFMFQTRYAAPYPVIGKLAERFPGHRFCLDASGEDGVVGSAVWKNGHLAIYVPSFDRGVSCNPEAITNEGMDAEVLIRLAIDHYGRDIAVDEDAVELVERAMAASGRSVTVVFESEEKVDEPCMYVEVEPDPNDSSEPQS